MSEEPVWIQATQLSLWSMFIWSASFVTNNQSAAETRATNVKAREGAALQCMTMMPESYQKVELSLLDLSSFDFFATLYLSHYSYCSLLSTVKAIHKLRISSSTVLVMTLVQDLSHFSIYFVNQSVCKTTFCVIKQLSCFTWFEGLRLVVLIAINT
jgi:hypothetical protein